MRGPRDARWYDADRGEVHRVLEGVYRSVADENAWVRDADEMHAGLYYATERHGVRASSRASLTYQPATLPYNVCRGAVDTLLAKVSKNRPLPQCLAATVDSARNPGDWSKRKRARRMTQFVEGTFYQQKFFERRWRPLIRDALVWGRGHLFVGTSGDEIVTDRVYPWEWLRDPWDAYYGEGTARNYYRVRSMDRGVAIALFAGDSRKKKEAIISAGRFELEDFIDGGSATVDRVDVIEAWHLPSTAEANDGRFARIVTGATLTDGDWTLAYPPVLTLTFSEALTGDIGHGLIEQLEGYQAEINRASRKSSEQHHMSGAFVFVHDQARIHDAQFTNGIGILRHGTPPGFPEPRMMQMDFVNEHTRQRPRELSQDALQDAGISALSARSEKPAGVNAAVALQALSDIETERFFPFARACEDFCVELARRYIDCAKEIAEEHGDFAVSVPMKTGILPLNWRDVEVDGIDIRVFPTSLLPQQPAARFEKLKDLWNTGVMEAMGGVATFLRLLDAPDLQAEMDLTTAQRVVVDEMLERMLDAEESEGQGAYLAPSPYQELVDEATGRPGWTPKRAVQKLNRALLDGAPEYNLDLLRQFLRHCDHEIAKLQPPPPPPMPAGAPPMPGVAPPPPPDAVPPELTGLGVPGIPA